MLVAFPWNKPLVNTSCWAALIKEPEGQSRKRFISQMCWSCRLVNEQPGGGGTLSAAVWPVNKFLIVQSISNTTISFFISNCCGLTPWDPAAGFGPAGADALMVRRAMEGRKSDEWKETNRLKSRKSEQQRKLISGQSRTEGRWKAENNDEMRYRRQVEEEGDTLMGKWRNGRKKLTKREG